MSKAQKVVHVLKIDYNSSKRHITLETLRPKRFKHYGFGTFLENIKPGEVLISKAALKKLMSCSYRNGLQGLDLFPQNVLSWGDPSPNMTVPMDAISVDPKAKTWLRKCKTF